ADVAVEAAAYLLGRRIGCPLEQRRRRDDEAGRAEAAHQRIDVAERLLDPIQRGAARQAFHRANLFALDVDRQRRARVDRAAVDDHRARAAAAAAADPFVPGAI